MERSWFLWNGAGSREILLASVLGLLALASSAGAQCLTGGCSLDLPAGQCGIDDPVCAEGDPTMPPECCVSGLPGMGCNPGGCNFLNNCRTPQVSEPLVYGVLEGNGTYTARLSVEVTARWNYWAGLDDNNPNGRLAIEWFNRGTVCTGTQALCQYLASDKTECWAYKTGLNCDDAPYDFGLYSMMASVCHGGFGACFCKANPFFCQCWRRVERPNIPFIVTRAALGCPDPPKNDCDCTSCALPGAPADGDGPRIGGGELGAGGGAYLYYAAGGAGHPGYPGTASWNVTLGRYWSHDYAVRIVAQPDEDHVWLITRRGTFREWRSPGVSGIYAEVSPSSEKRTLTWLGAGLGWELRELDGTLQSFGADGRWLSTAPPGRPSLAKTAFYDASGNLESVSFPDGRREDFTYYPPGDPSEGKLQTITEVGLLSAATKTWQYTWTGDDLARVDRPDGTALELFYDGTHPGYLSRIELVADVLPEEKSDPANRRVVRAYEYDTFGNVVASWRGDAASTGPDAVEVWRQSFDDPEHPTVTTVTDPLDGISTYTLGRDTVSSNIKVLSISGDCPVCGLGPNVQFSYADSQNPMLPTRITDARGTWTDFEYDAFGQVTRRIEAANDPGDDPDLPRETTWEHHADFHTSPTLIQGPFPMGGVPTREAETAYDPLTGDVESRTIRGLEPTYPTGSFALSTEYTYNGSGQPLTIDPPGQGTADQVSFTYDAARGNLFPLTREDPLPPSGTMTTSFGYDAFNRRTSVTEPNGLVNDMSYDDLDRVTEVRQVGASPPGDDLVTAHTYNLFGELFQTTLPRGNVIEYGYDAAGRVVSVERKPDASTPGERLLYTLDASGSRTLEDLQGWDAGSSAWLTRSATAYEYSTRCQVDRIVQAPGTAKEAVSEYGYDCNGNLVEQWDPNHDAATDPPTSTYSYDALNRLTAVSQPWAGGGEATTAYGYDVQDHLTAVTDAEGNTTSYTYSDRDLLTQEVSPVSGTTVHGYDEHGELTSTTDARGVSVTRGVDALDRVTSVDYPDDTLDTLYTYDAEPGVCGGTSFAIGRLGAIIRGGEAVEYCYDRFGRLTRDGELTYAYDANGNRTGIGYPGGLAATFSHDFADREVTLAVTSPGGTEPVVQAATYLPSGPLSTLQLGSGTTETRSFDGRSAPTAIALTGPVERIFSYTTDLVGNILEIVEQGACTPGPVVLESQTVTTTEIFTSCTTIEAGNGFAVEAPGNVTFLAEETIALQDGFSVGTGASFVGAAGGIPPTSVRSYTYQAPQYFLTGADGPWGGLDWTYDRIGNRLSETRNGGNPDLYQYLLNGASGNTSILDLVYLGVGSTRDYTWGAAGHVEEVAAGANVIEFESDAEGRLSVVSRTAAAETAAFSYDGRSFLRAADETAGGTSSVDPLYDSAGLLHALRRQSSPADPVEQVTFFYLAGRPVAQLQTDGLATETWTYLTTDHLGTALLATDDAGALTWEGGFEPFGRDYQEGTPAGAVESGVFLRLSGQWEDSSWREASSGAAIYYNVYRWYSPGVGRYTRPDPLKITGGANLWLYDPNTYLYAWANPIVVTDPLGLYGTNECSYYDQRCDECGGDYYCRLAPLACNTFPMYPDPDPNTDNDFEGWARCTRQCLQECDANNFEDRKECESDPCAGTGSFFDESHQVCHRVCYSFCHFWGTWGGGEPGMQPVFK